MKTKSNSTGMQMADLKALETVLRVLEPLAEEERERVFRWATEKLGIEVSRAKGQIGSKKVDPIDAAFDMHGSFDSVGEFVAAASPKTDADRVLCVATYLQEFNEVPNAALSGKQVNDVLKDLGHGIKNITDAINTLKARKPQHMIQTKKAGKAKQAWKEYRVTRAGIDHAYRLITEGAAQEAEK